MPASPIPSAQVHSRRCIQGCAPFTAGERIRAVDDPASPPIRRGTIYTTETYEGKRLQKFVYKGIGPVRKRDQGPPWPTSH